MQISARVIKGGNRVLEIKVHVATTNGMYEIEATGSTIFPAEEPIPKFKVDWIETCIKGTEDVVRTYTKDMGAGDAPRQMILKQGGKALTAITDEPIVLEWSE